MNFFRSLLLSGLTAAVATLATVPTPASAEACIRASSVSGGFDTLICDNDAGDADPLVGVILASVTGTGFTVNIDIGLSKPVVGTAAAPEIDLAFVVVTTTAGDLSIKFGDTDFLAFGSPVTGFLQIGGTTTAGATGTLDLRFFGANTLAGLGTSVDAINFAGSPFAVSTNASYDANSPYGLALFLDFLFTGAGSTTGDANFRVPEPATLALIGLGLMGLGVAGRRRRVK